jgi:hypothetical protein
MVPSEVSALHANPEWTCRYCGYREALPADAAELHRHLRLRLLQLQRAREAVEAPMRSFQMLRQAWLPGLGLVGAMALWQSYNLWNNIDHGTIDPAQAAFALFPLALAVGAVVGWLGMRRAFAHRLRPLLRARPPIHPGLAARCRSCGGDLPPTRGPQVTCAYCNATNMLDAALTTQAGALLAAEAQEYQRRVRAWATDPAVYLAPSRAFYRFAAVGAAVALLVGIAIVLAITAA